MELHISFLSSINVYNLITTNIISEFINDEKYNKPLYICINYDIDECITSENCTNIINDLLNIMINNLYYDHVIYVEIVIADEYKNYLLYYIEYYGKVKGYNIIYYDDRIILKYLHNDDNNDDNNLSDLINNINSLNVT